MGCKDTDFFLSSKFFRTFFENIFTNFIICTHKQLENRALAIVSAPKSLCINKLRNPRAALWGARRKHNRLYINALGYADISFVAFFRYYP